MSQKFTSIRRVRGDNYCALRATLFQAMSQPAALPSWLKDPELTLVRCCCRFEFAMFPVVFVRKSCLFSLCWVPVTVCSVTSACGFIPFRVAGMILHSKATKNNCCFPEENRGTMYLNSSAELKSWCLYSVKVLRSSLTSVLLSVVSGLHVVPSEQLSGF